MFTPEQLGERPQDMRLRLNIPQLNRVKYLVSQEIGRYVPASSVPEYEGGMPYLVVDDKVDTRRPTHPIDDVLRSADQYELDFLHDLRDQLDNLWSSLDGRKVSYTQDKCEPWVYGSFEESV